MTIFLRAITLVVWVLGFGSFLVPYPGIWGAVATGVVGFLLVAHSIETLYFLQRIRAAPTPFWPNAIDSFVFGMIHNMRYVRKN